MVLILEIAVCKLALSAIVCKVANSRPEIYHDACETEAEYFERFGVNFNPNRLESNESLHSEEHVVIESEQQPKEPEIVTNWNLEMSFECNEPVKSITDLLDHVTQCDVT